jgi:hypothetical protein
MADISNPPSNDATVQRNGRPATAEALGPLAFRGYAHFTALQVRGGKVRAWMFIFSACMQLHWPCSAVP